MNENASPRTSRREFLKNTGRLTAASALAGVALPRVHAAEDNTLRLAIIGCGGRGSGAVANALESPGGPVKLVAMADLFPDKLASSHANLTKQFGDKIDVPRDRQFLGFDAYRKAIDCLRPGDVVLCTTHAAFRGIHVEYAVEKGDARFSWKRNFAADPGGVKRILRAGEAAAKKNLKIAAGVMCRHSSARQALIQKMREGAMGEIQLIRAYRMDAGYRMGPLQREGERVALADPPPLPVPVGVFGHLPRADDPPDWTSAAGSRTAGRWRRTAWAVAGPTARIAVRTSTPTRSSTPSPTARRRW